ncbi:hypothetical protein IPC1132_10920 [Pseudomonas aeruginosa]|uniref:hypothetical protein n=1 Tax=Pseudomonas aeruginosa TaxID=287 RepID=UPI000FC42D3E|nr:hypothetical protein [Pseudomonas aeruginosa]MBW6333075.1 hypothetical protein [Pseudomonas aeruginosa]RUF31654.1 hypothetical protein IPC1132_10920 [Pseudomonas aeruginosa]HCT6924805.1 hypothetical protein [Pseudomonas aeruginosa]
MSKQSYTPGPWYRDGTTVYALNPQNFNRFSAQIHGAHTPKSELEAVAQLMQAAPELLEALEYAANRLNSCLILLECDDDFIAKETAQARAAIAKATA